MECTCGAPTDGKWAGKHTTGCAALQSEQTGWARDTQADKVDRLQSEISRLRVAIMSAVEHLDYDSPDKAWRVLKTALDQNLR